jgi:hypothetical protein
MQSDKFTFNGWRLLSVIFVSISLGACGTYASVSRSLDDDLSNRQIPLEDFSDTVFLQEYRATLEPDYIATLSIDSNLIGIKVDPYLIQTTPGSRGSEYYYRVHLYHSKIDSVFINYVDTSNKVLSWEKE